MLSFGGCVTWRALEDPAVSWPAVGARTFVFWPLGERCQHTTEQFERDTHKFKVATSIGMPYDGPKHPPATY